MDRIRVAILKDGTIKIETDPISAANHLQAEDLVNRVEKLAGGSVTVQHKSEGMGHHHGVFEHEHVHGGF